MRSVFFLDDSVEFLEVMTVFVKATCACNAITCTNLDSMFARAEEILKTEMAFLDINLGNHQASGIQAYRWLRSHGYTKPIYFLTGHAKDSDEAKQALIFEETQVIQKPIAPKELRDLIGTA